jgi:glycerol-3-phosphate dehydrogenase
MTPRPRRLGAPVDGVADAVVVGGGVVGCAIARELVLRGLRVVLVEARDDVGEATSKANTAIWHTGFDASPGSLEAGLVARGYHLLGAYAARAGVPIARTGALLVAWDDEQLATLPLLAEKAAANGYGRTREVDAAELRAREPHLGPGALGAMEVPDEGIVCSWTTALAFATEALALGLDLRLGTRLVGVETGGGQGDARLVAVLDSGERVPARVLVNAAGLGSDLVDRMLGHDGFTITPRRGELIVFDKLARPLVQHVLLPVPSSRGKGVLVAPTVYGNVMLGPTAEDLDDRSDTSSSEAGLELLREKGSRLMPALLRHEVTAVYAGLRAATEHSDYQLRAHDEQGYICVGGIRSTGLTASMAIAEHVAALLPGCGVDVREPRTDVQPPVMANIGETAPRPFSRADRVAADPAYGRIVCHCERVTDGELRDAFASALPPRSLEALKRRTRVQMGRCGGFFCGAAVRARLEESVHGDAS